MLEILLNRKVLPLSLSSLISKTGDFAHDVVFVLITIELLSADIFMMGVVYFLRFIPYLFLGPIGGWLSDIFPHKNIMIANDILRCVVTFLMFTTYISGLLNIYILIIFSMLMTAGRSLFQPCFRAWLPTAIDKKQLPAGNSLFQIIEDVSSISGPLVCSVIIIISDKAWVLLLDSISYFLSVILLIFLQKNPSSSHRAFSLSRVFFDTKLSICTMHRHNKKLFKVIIGTSLCVLFTAALLRYVLPASILAIYGDEKLVGYIYSIMAAGTVVGGISYTFIIKHTTPLQLMKSWMIYGFMFLLVSIAIKFSLMATVIFIALLGFSGAIVDISIITNIQSLSFKNEMGKNYGLFSTLANTCESLSGLATGILSVIAGGFAFSVMALFIAASAGIMISKLQGVKE